VDGHLNSKLVEILSWPLYRNWGLGGTLSVLTHFVLSGLIGCARDCQQSHYKGRDDPAAHEYLANSSVVSPIPKGVPKGCKRDSILNRVLVKSPPHPFTQYGGSTGSGLSVGRRSKIYELRSRPVH
jgi:hypothetical protein